MSTLPSSGQVDAEPSRGFGVGVLYASAEADPHAQRALVEARQRRLEQILPWATGFLLSVPALIAFYPPMTDLPYHEAAIGILRHFRDAEMFPPGLYRLNLGEPNQLFHMAGWALSYVVSTRWAVKLLVVATIVAIPPSAAHLARYIGASSLAALLVAPMAVGWLLYWGLITNLIGLAALLVALPGLDRFAQAPSLKGALSTMGSALLLYFAHEGVMIVYMVAALGLALTYAWSVRLTLLRFVPFAFGGALAIAQAKWQARFMTPALRAMPLMWDSFWAKLKTIPHLILPATDVGVRLAMFALCLGTIVGLFWLRAREPRRLGREIVAGASRSARLRSWVLAHRWEVFATVCMGAYFAFPLTLNGATFVYHRWFPPGFAVLVIVATPRDLWTRRARVLRLAIIALPVATLLVQWPSFVDSSRAYAALEPVLAWVEPGSAVAQLDFGPPDPTRTFTLGPAAGRILATRGGRLAYAFTDSSVSPVVIARRYQWNESLVRVAFDGWAFRPQQDLRRFKYVLARANDGTAAYLATRALAPETELVIKSGEWLLFKSQLETVPPVSRDHWIVGPPSENIRDRVHRIVGEQVQLLTPEECPPDSGETEAP